MKRNLGTIARLIGAAILTVLILSFLFPLACSKQDATFERISLDSGVNNDSIEIKQIPHNDTPAYSINDKSANSEIHFDIIGFDSLQYPNSGTYTGNFLNAKREGNGTFLWDNGDKYEGEFSSDLMNGTGVYTFSNGRVLSGEFINNSFVNGSYKYTGASNNYCFIIQAKKILSAEISFSDGSFYSGECNENGLYGDGTFSFSNGDEYIGHFSNGLRDGIGKYIWSNRDYYSGKWNSDRMSGEGVYHFITGETFSGTFRDNRFISGSYSFVNNGTDLTVHVNNESQMVGIIFSTEDGFQYDGDYTKGSLTGKATITYPSGDRYTGAVKNGLRDGQGTYYWKSGAYYTGSWVSDMMEGKGTYFYANKTDGYKLICSFKSNKPIGDGTYYVTETRYYGTTWKNGKCIKVTE